MNYGLDWLTLIGGGAAEIVDVVDTISGEFPRTAAVVILATLIILAVLLVKPSGLFGTAKVERV